MAKKKLQANKASASGAQGRTPSSTKASHKNSPTSSVNQSSPVTDHRALVPAWLVLPLWAIALALPNLVYSGIKFADTLHILKWTVAGVPVAIAALVAGWRLFQGKAKLEFDLFGILWAFLLALCLMQTLWVQPSSPTGYVHEMICFAAVWVFYVLTISSFPARGLRVLLWLANINAAINVLFAELQIRGMNDLAFLQGTWLEPLRGLRSLILPTPGNYIGNTAQQNMFGLWMAICVMNSVFLFLTSTAGRSTDNVSPVRDKRASWVRIALQVVNCLLLIVNSWGLWNSTSRSGILSLFAGLSMLALLTVLNAYRLRLKAKTGSGVAASLTGLTGRRLLIALILFVAVLGGTMAIEGSRSMDLIAKTGDMLMNAGTVGGRIGIWTTSKSMFLEHPMGVGVGQYKWHYMEGQRAGFARLGAGPEGLPDWYTWQYTHWAHNEFLQWFCEAGLLGGGMLLVMYGLWIGALASRTFSSKFTRWFMSILALCTVVFLDLTLFTGLSLVIRISADILIAAAFALMLGLANEGLLASSDLNVTPVGNSQILSPEVLWGAALVVLISFNAFWTRPFHRIENILWLTLAFSLTNRELLTGKFGIKFSFTKSFTRIIGVVFMICSIGGIVYLGSGIEGNYLLRQALSTQTAEPQRDYLEQAMKHPITYEDAMRNLGYHCLQLGEQLGDFNMLNEGFNLVWAHFQHESHSEDYGPLMTWAQKLQVEPVILELASYMRPGSYRLTRQKAIDSNGREVNALIIQNISEPEPNPEGA